MRDSLRKSFPSGELESARFATRGACYRGWKPQNCPKWLGEGAKGVLVHVDQKPVALVQTRVTLVQNRVALVQETLGRPFLQLAKHILHPLLTTLGNFEVSCLCSRHLGSQHKIPQK